MTTTAARLITLILMLQRQPGQKAADLASQLGVSIRTLHRYFENLDEMGVPVYAERGPYGGFFLMPGYKLPPLVFTPEEAVAISLGTSLVHKIWGKLYQEAAQGALAKLENVLPAEQRQEIAWAQHSLVVIGMNRADIEKLTPFLDKLRRAVRENYRVSMTYQNSNSPRCEQREVDPYVLVHRSGWWYMIGFCHLRQEIRTFRVDRIAELNLMDQIFSLPAGFDVDAYMAQEWKNKPQITVRMRFTPQLTHLAQYAQSYWAAHEEQPDGSVIVTFNTPDVYAAASTVLAYGPGVTVLEPPEVRQMVQEWAREVANLY